MDKIVEAFKVAGFDLYLVGGCVRDELLGIANKDRDYCTDALPDQSFDILRQFGKPYRIGEKFGTIGMGNIEVTTFRSERYDKNSRKPHVEFGTSLHEDLRRRDFTINAIAFDEEDQSYIDLSKGIEDINNKIIRCVGDANERFKEDPLRMLRAIRFASRFNFSIEDKTYNAIVDNCKSIFSISQERIRDELNSIIIGDNVAQAFAHLKDSGLLGLIAPELMMLTDSRPQGRYHDKTIWDHSFDVTQRVPGDLTLRWTALLHDVGKMATRTIQGNDVHYYGHEEVSAMLADSLLRRLRFPNSLITRVCKLVKNHMRINTYRPQWRNSRVRNLVDALGDEIYLGIELAIADQDSHIHSDLSILDLRDRIDHRDTKRVLSLPINGNDLMKRYDKKPGPWIQCIKEELQNQMEDGIISPDDREAALKKADDLFVLYP